MVVAPPSVPSSHPPLSLNALLRARTSTHPTSPVLATVLPSSSSFSYGSPVTFAHLDTAATLAARHLASDAGGGLPVRKKGDTEMMRPVALLAGSDLAFVVTYLALLRMGYSVLFISINNSPPAIAHLLASTDCLTLIVDAAHADAGADGAAALAVDGKGTVRIVPQPKEAEVYSSEMVEEALKRGDGRWEWPLDEREEENMVAAIIHSSGSTGFPKPIAVTHRQFMTSLANLSDQDSGTFCAVQAGAMFSTLPMYHALGHYAFWTAFLRLEPVYLFPASDRPLTAKNLVALLSTPDCASLEILLAVPTVFKILTEEEEGIQLLQRFKFCLFSGGGMPEAVGDHLLELGVRNFAGMIGSTENGAMVTSSRDFKTDTEWNYYRFEGPMATRTLKGNHRFEHVDGKGSTARYELIILDGFPSKAKTNRPDGSYATSDAFMPHPTIPGAWKHVGRLDDTLVHVTGEKTNPVPMEEALRGVSSAIAEAIVFGHDRPSTGALILLSGSAPKGASREELERLVRPAVDAANEEAPSHSRLTLESLIFLPHRTMIPKADKDTILRPKVYAAFATEIDAHYGRLNGEVVNGATTQERKRQIHSRDEVLREIKGFVQGSLAGRSVANQADLFEAGLDSVQAALVRSKILRAFDLGGAKLATNFVFDHPTIDLLTERVMELSSGQDAASTFRDVPETTLRLLEKYRKVVMETLPSSGRARSGRGSFRCVVLTGATGSLGAHVLHQLLSDPSVETIYSLSRAKDDVDAAARVAESMATRRLQYDPDGRLVCLAADLGAEHLGLFRERYEEISEKATMVLHYSWPVNFNLGIASFESHIRGAAHLMQLALRPSNRPADFWFASSVSTMMAAATTGAAIPEAVSSDPSTALPSGYALSKWVIEGLCRDVQATTSLRSGVFRIGQMVGDSMNGIWNESEAMSLLIKSANTLGVLPALSDRLSWLPVDIAARVCLELASCAHPAGAAPCFNVVNPRLLPWENLLKLLKQAGLEFDVVERREWIERLRASKDDLDKNPTRKLLAFYEGMYSGGEAELSAQNRRQIDTTLAERAAPSLAACEAPDDKLVAQWIASWRSSGFLS